MNIKKNEILNEMKYIRFLEFSKDDKKCFLNYDNNMQIFTFAKLPSNVLNWKNEEIYEKINLKNQNQNFEILRLKKCKNSNKMNLVINSQNSIEHNRIYFSNLKFVKIF